MIKNKLYFLERLDEQGRFRGLEVHLDVMPGQYKTHGYSYLYMRNQRKENLDEIMAFDKSIFKHLLQEEYYKHGPLFKGFTSWTQKG